MRFIGAHAVRPTPRELSRRAVLGLTAGLLAGCVLQEEAVTRPGATDRRLVRRVPAEDVPHQRTWMAWPSNWAIWGGWLPGVQRDIALIARTITRYEPVVVCATDAAAAQQARRLCGQRVRVIDTIPVDDCWMRDSGPVFGRSDGGGVAALGLGFNGWGDRQAHPRDRLVARRVSQWLDVPFERAGVVGEGGGVECDGDGTLLATESCWVNDNRNPGMTREQIERELLDEYGATKMIWLPGLRGRDITDDHVDATSRFVRPGVVMVQVPPTGRDDVWAEDAREQLRILSESTDAQGRRLQIVEMAGPRKVRSDYRGFVDSYVNFAHVNGAVITAQFGDRDRDRACHETLRDAFPGREIVQLNLDRLHNGGGGVHCVTQQQPVVA